MAAPSPMLSAKVCLWVYQNQWKWTTFSAIVLSTSLQNNNRTCVYAKPNNFLSHCVLDPLNCNFTDYNHCISLTFCHNKMQDGGFLKFYKYISSSKWNMLMA